MTLPRARARTGQASEPGRATSEGTPAAGTPTTDSPPVLEDAHKDRQRAPRRWHFLDTLRGVALLGILLVNSLDITSLGLARLVEGADPARDPVREALYLGVQTRFVPIFAFLFGMSLWLVLAAARRRLSDRAWLVLLRRLLVLGIVGQLLTVVYRGNILTEYSIFGLIVLPLALFLPRRVLLGTGLVATAAAYALFGGGEPTTFGLITAGAGAAACGLPSRLERAGRGVVVAFLVSAVSAAPAVVWQLSEPGDPRFTVGGIAGVVLAVTYSSGLALLWRTPLRGPLQMVFDPLGRMALTNYVGAAVVFAALARLVDFGHMSEVTPAVLLSLLVVAVQSLLSRMWLRRFRYGPIEWLWRAATWWTVPALQRRPAERS